MQPGPLCSFRNRRLSLRWRRNRPRVRSPPPPLSRSLKDKEVPEQPSGMAASGQRRPDAAGESLATNDAVSSAWAHTEGDTLPSAVARIAEAWPSIRSHRQDATLTLVDIAIQRR